MSKLYRMQLPQGSGKSPSRGFTLIELLIVVAIVAILASIGYPSYRNQVIKGNRAAAQGYLLSLASREEQYMLDRRQYKAAASNAEIGAANSGLPSVPAEVAQLYNITIVAPVAATPPTFLITATPIAGTIQAPDGAISLDNTGEKLPAAKWK